MENEYEKKKIKSRTNTHIHSMRERYRYSNIFCNTCSIILNSFDIKNEYIWHGKKKGSNSKTMQKHVHTQKLSFGKQFLTCFNRSKSIA